MSQPGVTTPQPQQPTPLQLAGWQNRRSTARSNYGNQLAQGNYQRNVAQADYAQNTRNLAFNQQQQRQTFDDPYLARGIFNSGIRRQGLSNFLTGYANQQSGLDLGLANALGGIDVANTQAQNTLANLLAGVNNEELASRAQLAADIRGII